ncbi:MAG: chromosomal replication initiator protein DnaA [Phycisphaerae bacterium]|jgi:chromosomal replication initiator protein
MNSTTDSVRADNCVNKEILAALQDRIGPQKFNAWFRHGTAVTIEDGHVRVSVPNPFVANWIETHYQSEIAEAANVCTGTLRPVVLTVDPALPGQLRQKHLDAQAQMVSRAGDGTSRPRQAPQAQSLKYSLKDFVVGTSNRLAYSAALAAVGTQRPSFNPLFIHGLCGVGKTHLIQGICSAFSAVRRAGRAMQWRYVSGEQFTNEFITALRHKKIDEFRGRYRHLDLLAIDDVHFLASKKATQDEFLHTFNAIESAGKMIVMASDAAPRLMGELNEQLVSRFAAGMVVKIDAPDHALRIEILRRKAQAMKIEARDEALEYLARHIHGSVRDLEGALIKLSALASLDGRAITTQLAESALADHLARTDSAITLGDIEAVVTTFFGITTADIHSSRRTRTVSAARMVAMFLARRHTQMSYPEIGQYMGKNHSSAVLAVQRMEAMLAAGEEVKWLTPAGTRSAPAGKLIELLTQQIV